MYYICVKLLIQSQKWKLTEKDHKKLLPEFGVMWGEYEKNCIGLNLYDGLAKPCMRWND